MKDLNWMSLIYTYTSKIIVNYIIIFTEAQEAQHKLKILSSFRYNISE